MKTSHRRVMGLLLSLASVTTHAAVVVNSGTLETAIPDDVSTGLAHTITVPDSFELGGVTVSLNLSVPAGQTGWFGDIYGYLQHGSVFSVLINRPGKSVSNPTGYNDGTSVVLTLADSAVNGDIHSYRAALSGSESIGLTHPLGGLWAPDGRAVDPGSAVVSDARNALLGQFTGLDSSGNWTLFLADLSSGGSYRLDSWGLNLEGVSPVPEPAVVASATGLALVGWTLLRRRAKPQPSRP